MAYNPSLSRMLVYRYNACKNCDDKEMDTSISPQGGLGLRNKLLRLQEMVFLMETNRLGREDHLPTCKDRSRYVAIDWGMYALI